MRLTTPVALTIFNRPDTTERVFREIALAKPATLLVVADGPRPGIPGDVENCIKARMATETIDWDCEVLRNYSDENLGCRRRMSSGLDWVFATVEEAIILEDDCLPSQAFFGYCQELLEYYRNDTRVMQICGSNLLKEWHRTNNSYLFSNYGPIWGWASWRRAWQYYDVDMKLWPEIRGNNLHEDFCQSSEEAKYRFELYNKVYNGDIDTWDYQWGFAKMINCGLCITPIINLIKNIGFGVNSTHTSENTPFSNLERSEIELPLKHPKYTIRDKEYDIDYNKLYLTQTRETVCRKILKVLSGR